VLYRGLHSLKLHLVRLRKVDLRPSRCSRTLLPAWPRYSSWKHTHMTAVIATIISQGDDHAAKLGRNRPWPGQ
jgi:hypothetical protein